MSEELKPVIDETELIEEKFVEEEETERKELNIDVKDRKLVTHPYDYIIRSLNDQIIDGSLILADKYQRRRVWDDKKASRLIESLLLNVPIPVCYFAELPDGIYSVIDGQQRLTAISRYLNNEFKLKGVRVRVDIKGKQFYELNESDQRLIKNRAIRCIVILKESNPDIRFDVFERLNSGSVRLNNQELRNSMHRGTLNDLLVELSEDKLFIKIRNAPGVDKRMQDCEMILRFFSFYNAPNEYRGYFSDFLDDYLKKGISFTSDEIEKHRKLFLETLNKVFVVFEGNAFRKFSSSNKVWEKIINRAIYDVIMLSFSRLEQKTLTDQKENIVNGFKELMTDQYFLDSITSSTKDKKKIQTRVDKWWEKLSKIGLEVPYLKIGD